MRSDSRRIKDRRRHNLVWEKERRVRPDRRLNNISVEWIPFGEVYSHPSTRDAFCSINRNVKTEVQSCHMDVREKEPIKAAWREKKRWPISGSEANIFKRNQSVRVEQRKGTERRRHKIKLPYDRRIRADRRISKISVEWIDC